MPVKSTNVSSMLKMNGEMLTVQVTDMSTVIAHSPLLILVMVLGPVMISTISLLISYPTMIPTMMVLSILMITSINLI